MIPYYELLDNLSQLDEITVMELLEVSTEDLIDRFEDRIQMKIVQIEEGFSDEQH